MEGIYYFLFLLVKICFVGISVVASYYGNSNEQLKSLTDSDTYTMYDQKVLGPVNLDS